MFKKDNFTADPKLMELPEEVKGEQVQFLGEDYYKISNVDKLRPFFMSIVSDANHWLFIASNGGLSAGRKNAQYALFPYYTDDKITESVATTGAKTIFKVQQGNEHLLWEPFSVRNTAGFTYTRNLYKNSYGNKIVFEEINHDLALTFRYQWASSNTYGFVRTASLINHAEVTVQVAMVDGLQNVLPYGVPSATQTRASNLVDAYKRTELEPNAGLGMFTLSAIIVDKAEPSEALKANVVWSLGMPNATRLLSAFQLDAFRAGKPLQQEQDIKGEKGAYFLYDSYAIAPSATKEWSIVANVNQDRSGIISLCEALKEPHKLQEELQADVALGTKKLVALNAAADGLQCTADSLKDTRHFANTLFNIMRGGIFDDGYTIELQDFKTYLAKASHSVYKVHKATLDQLPAAFSLQSLRQLAAKKEDQDFERLCLEYLPLKFSRRHGDPSRPWNIFSINTHSELDGSKILDYQGNWRDIFQNWEALALAYPAYIDGMILKFFNASTFDGYNPYRVTKDGFDWEIIEPDDPWSYIGYWGDHQIIYSLKFLEFIQNQYPERLAAYFNKEIFVYANVPYKIKAYQELLDNPKDTIDFDQELDVAIRKDRERYGADGALLRQKAGAIHRVNFIEKMLASVLAKISNFIPEGGIWLNTQRPEWNDANNALVGNGVSMVTLYYLRRYLRFFDELLINTADFKVALSSELLVFFKEVQACLQTHSPLLAGRFSDKERKTVLDGLGMAASKYRSTIYATAFSGVKEPLSATVLKEFIQLSLAYLEHTIAANKRTDQLYHSYNLMTVVNQEELSISYLDEMLEGQVAALSAGVLTATEALALLDGLKQSALYRADQNSYILYPNKELPKFLEKNVVPTASVKKSALLSKLIATGNQQIVKQDVLGTVHFNGNFKNANDLAAALDSLVLPDQQPSPAERQAVLAVFEAVFDHKSFTGRSGTFFGYEGLGSIYWHMVSKLLLAVQECSLKAIKEGANKAIVDRLAAHYYDINEGIGVHKSPAVYGAFPTDPYSHTPAGRGAQQPGMTGQVKEDVLSRFGELGVSVQEGQLRFLPVLLRKTEFLAQTKTFNYIDLKGVPQEMALAVGSLAFTYCQLPIVYTIGEEPGIKVRFKDGTTTFVKGSTLPKALSKSVFLRDNSIQQLAITIDKVVLR